MIVFKARGISILNNIKYLLQPNALPASLNLFSTCRIPRLVSLITGASEKIIIEITPGVSPTPKSITTGIRYTKLGIVCITSKIGRRIVSKILLLEAKIPSGIPIIMQKRTAVKIIAKVVIVSDHTSTRSMKIKLIIVKIVNLCTISFICRKSYKQNYYRKRNKVK
jgi:hypothetical protein